MQIVKKLIRNFFLKIAGEDYLEKKLFLIGTIASKKKQGFKKN